MNVLTKTVLSVLTLATLAAAPLAHAQTSDSPKAERRAGPGGPGGPQGEERIKMMTERLGLSADQKTRLQAVMKSQRDALAKLRDDTSLTREARREKMEGMREAQMVEVRAILTPEQAAKWDSAMAEGGRRGGGPPDGAGRRGKAGGEAR